MAEDTNLQQKYFVMVPGIIRTYTTSYSNAQALTYAIHKAFESRNEFLWHGKRYWGEQGRDELVNALLHDPGFQDFVQALPGLPSYPVEIPLPMVPVTGKVDLDMFVVQAMGNNDMLTLESIENYLVRVSSTYSLGDEDLDALARSLYGQVS